MQKVYEGVINHVWMPLVDETDFATLESGIAASSVKASVFGFLKGSSSPGSLVSNGTGSLAGSGRDFYTVHSGVIGVILGTTELSDAQNAFYDKYLLFASVTGAAIQIMELEGEYKDTSDIFEAISDVDSQLVVNHSLLSDVDSQLLLNASVISDAHSAAALAASHASDVDSQLDITASKVLLIQSQVSDVDSQLVVTASQVVLIQSNVSDVDSQLTVTHSLLSDVDSQVLLNASVISDAHSAAILAASHASDALSVAQDVDSQLTATHSLLSDVESQVDLLATSDYLSNLHSVLTSTVSDILSAAQQGNSRTLVVQSMVSDVDSQLLLTASLVSDIDSQVDLLATSDYLSGLHSDLRSQISGITASVSASDISDIASAVEAILSDVQSNILSAAQQGASRALVVQSMVSDVDSQLDVSHSLLSDVESQVDLLATSDYLSAVHSDLKSAIGNVSVTLDASDVSDIASAVNAQIGSLVSDTYSLTQALSAAIGNGQITTVSPIQLSGDIEIVKGDDYNNSDSRALTWTTSTSGQWPDLTGATITFTAKKVGETALTKTGTVVTETGANKSVRVELTASDTTIAVGRWSYDVQAVLSSGRIVTLSRKVNGLEVLSQYTTA